MSVSTLWTKSWKIISPFNTVQITDNGGAFSIWPNNIPEKSLCYGFMMDSWSNFTSVLAKLYPKLWGIDEPLNFLSFVGINYSELKHFSEMVL